MSKQQFIQDLIEPTIIKMGYEFWGLKLANHGRRTFLQVFIDAEKGINLKDCSEVALQVGTLLDVEDPITGKYDLEISSPGLDREFFKLEQCEEFKGREVKVRLFHKFSERKKFIAEIVAIDKGQEKIHFLNETKEAFDLDFSLIQKMQLII